MSEIKVNSIKGVGSTDAAITINNSDGTCTANITNRSNRNIIINGAMQVAVRGTSSTAVGYGTIDRFAVDSSGTDEAPTQEQVDVASGTSPYTEGFRKAFKITNGNQTSGAGATDYIGFRQTIEAQNLANSGWNYNSASSFVTLSFWIKSSVAQSFEFNLRTEDGTNYLYLMNTGSLSADTWTKVIKTIPGNSNLTINNDTGVGANFYLMAFSGTTYTNNSATENAWQVYSSGILFGRDSTSTWYTTNDATLEITGVQLEVGSVATDFEHRSFGQELALCQRYFYQVSKQGSSSDVSNAPIGIGNYDNSSTFQAIIPFPVTMRTNPSLISSDTTNCFYVRREGSADFLDNFSLFYSTKNRARIFNNTDASGSAGAAGDILQETGDSNLAFNAEL